MGLPFERASTSCKNRFSPWLLHLQSALEALSRSTQEGHQRLKRFLSYRWLCKAWHMPKESWLWSACKPWELFMLRNRRRTWVSTQWCWVDAEASQIDQAWNLLGSQQCLGFVRGVKEWLSWSRCFPWVLFLNTSIDKPGRCSTRDLPKLRCPWGLSFDW